MHFYVIVTHAYGKTTSVTQPTIVYGNNIDDNDDDEDENKKERKKKSKIKIVLRKQK